MSALQLKDIVGQTKAFISKIHKEDLVNLLHSTKEFEDQADLKAIRDSIEDLKNNVINLLVEDNKKLRKKLDEIEEANQDLEDKIDDLHFQVSKNDRYSRRNNIEIGGIPEQLDGHLEEITLAILNKIDVKCSSSDIEACHRLMQSKKEKRAGYPKRTIVRFVNRRFSEQALGNRKKLKGLDMSPIDENLSNTKCFIGDNLCPYDTALLGMCKQLYAEKIIAGCWSWKGSIFVKMNQDDLHSIKIADNNDLFSRFNDFEFF